MTTRQEEKLGIYTYTFPTYWASYLINGDSSGLEEEDIIQCDNETRGLGSCVDVSQESHFAQFKGLGTEVSEYKFRTEYYKVFKVFRKSRRKRILEVNLTLSEAQRVVKSYPKSSRSMVVYTKQSGFATLGNKKIIR